VFKNEKLSKTNDKKQIVYEGFASLSEFE